LLRRPEINYANLPQEASELEDEVVRQVEIRIKYAGYIKREQERIESARKYETQIIPSSINYAQITGLRHEACEKLAQILPENLGQASRISGVNPSDISILSMWMKRMRVN
jgi:tRNA uridine 5-carboxymethylaminomethyl modification enzyme